MLFGFGSPTHVNARAFLVIGSADALRPADADLKAESLTWLDAAAQRQESTYPDFIKTRKTKGIILAEASDAQLAPIRLEPDFNISLGYEERGGWIKRMDGSHRHGPGSEFMVDGDVETWWELLPGGYSFRPGIDLGGIFPVNRIVFYTHPDRPFQYLDEFALLGNDGDPEKVFQIVHHLGTDIEPTFETIYEETENTEWMVVTEFPTRPLRYVSILAHPGRGEYCGGCITEYGHAQSAASYQSRKGFEIAELEIYGEGYVPQASYISEIIDILKVVPDLPGEQASWGRLHWIGWRDEEAQVVIRTRTGGFDEDEVVPDPTAYSCFTGRGDQLSYQKDGQPLTLSDYRGRSCTKGPLSYDTENWSFWSPPYDFDQGVEGTAIASPGPARYIQVRIDFYSTVTDGAGLEAIGFDFSRPPSASRAVAEIFPREVAAATDTVFTYIMFPTLVDTDRGFDSLQIETFVRPTAVRSVRVGASTICSPCLPEGPETEILDDGLIVHFDPVKGRAASKTPVEVVFEAQVVRYGTEFRSWIFGRDEDEVRQLVEGGDATKNYSGGGTAVAIPFTGQLIAGVEVTPSVFTPNGDGVNDRTRLSFALLNLSEASEVGLAFYDLSGRLVRRLEQGQLLSDRYDEYFWDGLSDADEPVPPGHYLYDISVETDEGGEHRTGVVSVAY